MKKNEGEGNFLKTIQSKREEADKNMKQTKMNNEHKKFENLQHKEKTKCKRKRK